MFPAQDMYLKLSARTSPDLPLPPRDLEETKASLRSDGASRQLQWLPPYPPRGKIEYYTVRWRRGSENDSVWEGRADVFPESGRDLCPSDDFGRVDPYERRVCHTIGGFTPEQDVVFQVIDIKLDINRCLTVFSSRITRREGDGSQSGRVFSVAMEP